MRADSDELDEAVRAGEISAEQAIVLRNRRAARDAPEEPFRLVGSFGDLFLCLGLLIVYWSIGAFLRIAGIDPLLIFGGFAVLFWLLAEFFVFSGRRKFPAVVSILLFAWMGYRALALLLFGGSWPLTALAMATVGSGGSGEIAGHLGLLSGLLALALIRFRQPVLVLALGLTGTLLAFALARLYLPEMSARLVLMACGIAMLVLGYLLDRSDPHRTGIRHEWALWLFVLGSPLTVHPLFIGVIGDRIAAEQPSTLEAFFEMDFAGVAWTVAALAAGFSLLGLALDRRSLVASTLLYLSAVLTYASLRGGIGASVAFAAVPLTVGLLVVLLGMGWRPLRRGLLAALPLGGLVRPAE